MSDKEILKLADWGRRIEDYYSKLAKHKKPMDIEWAKDGLTGKLYIVQARPETVAANKSRQTQEVYKLKTISKPILQGVAVGQKIGAGKVRIGHPLRGGCGRRV